MKYILTAIAAIAFAACTTENIAPLQAKGAHPCQDARVAALDTTKDCADLKDIHPDCFGCAVEDYREAVNLWAAKCAELECPWCEVLPFECD